MLMRHKIRRVYRLLLLVFSFSFLVNGFASDDLSGIKQTQKTLLEEEKTPYDEFFSVNYASAFKRMMMSLLGLVALIVFSYWMIKRILNQRAKQTTDLRRIRILEKKVLSPKTVLYLIEADQEKVLVSESHLEIRALNAPKKASFSLHSNEHSEKVTSD